jgi:hypothetical protein
MATEVLPLGGFGKPSAFGQRQSLPEHLKLGRKAAIRHKIKYHWQLAEASRCLANLSANPVANHPINN